MQPGHRRTRAVPATLLLVCALIAQILIVLPAASPADAAPNALTYLVNSPADVPDASPGDGVCDTGGGVCTLRAAVQETNKHTTTSVTISLQPGVTYLLTRPGIDNTALNGDLDITGTVTIEGGGPESTVIDGNGALTLDRVFEVTGTVVISGVTVQHGRAPSGYSPGAGIYSKHLLTVVNSRILDNRSEQANGIGGGVYGLTVTVRNSLVAGNVISATGGVYGGGIYAVYDLRVENSTIRDNRATGASGIYAGGGINVGFGRALIVSSTISGNASDQGAGLSIGGADIVNSTISGNYASGPGGGIIVYGLTPVNVHNVTIAGNVANFDFVGSSTGGGIYAAGGTTVNLANSIVAGNGRGAPGPYFYYDDCSGTITSLGYNIVQVVNAAHCTMVGIYGTGDPVLAPLQFNGGSTQTHALWPGSAAINAGNPGGCTDLLGAPLTTDQRGKPRPVFGSFTRCDLGAFEVVYDTFLPFIRR